MENIQWKPKARLVGYVDLVLGPLAVLLFTTYAIVGVVNGITHTPVGWFILLVFSASVVLQCVHTYMAYQLIQSTKETTGGLEALGIVKVWQIASVVTLILSVGSLSAQNAWLLVGTSIILRVAFVFVVYKFMKELGG